MKDIFDKITNKKYKILYTLPNRSICLTDNEVIKITTDSDICEYEYMILNILYETNFKYSPKPLSHGKIGIYYYIIKEYINGETLEKISYSMDELTLNNILKNLKYILQEIHNLDFNNHFKIKNIIDYYDENSFKNYPNTYELVKKNLYEIIKNEMVVFIHGDFHPRNIIINNNKIVGIIDWEYSRYAPISEEGYSEYFHITPGQEYFGDFLKNNCMNDHKILMLRHLIHCNIYEKEDKAIKLAVILNNVTF